MVSGISLASLTLLTSILFSSCSSTKHANAKFDRTVAKLEKKNQKKGRKVEVDDLYYSKKDAEQATEVVVSYEEPPKEYKHPDMAKNSNKNRKVAAVVSTAKSYLGTPHRLGGMSKSGIDCSGLMIQSFKKVDISLPRTSSEQSRVGQQVSISNLKEGDLLFFSLSRNKISHVGVVSKVNTDANEIRFIHTSTSKGVREDNLYSDYWRKSFTKARRIL